MLPHEITPVILTYNEAPNIGRLLDRLAWAHDIVVVDSFSSDRTVAIVEAHPKARLIQRRFDCHANQWNFAVSETGIATPWVLALDADYMPADGFLGELEMLEIPGEVAGIQAQIEYSVMGRVLRGAVYPPVTVLFRSGSGIYLQDGHTQRLQVRGELRTLRSRFTHDDRKSLARWIESQCSYAQLEFEKLSAAPPGQLRMVDRIRKSSPLAPALVFLYCLILRGNILDGRAGLYYACQRAFAELLLLLHFLDAPLRRRIECPQDEDGK